MFRSVQREFRSLHRMASEKLLEAVHEDDTERCLELLRECQALARLALHESDQPKERMLVTGIVGTCAMMRAMLGDQPLELPDDHRWPG